MPKHFGYSSAYLLTKSPDTRTICIEPDLPNLEALQRNLAPFGDRVKLVHGALWADPCPLNFEAETLIPGREWGRRVEISSSGDVKAFDMPTIRKMASYEHIDLSKIDIEGAEDAVFSAPNLEWITMVKNIVIEDHGENCKATFKKSVGQPFRVSGCGKLIVCMS